jgi:hypothetical protein
LTDGFVIRVKGSSLVDLRGRSYNSSTCNKSRQGVVCVATQVPVMSRAVGRR